MNAIDWSVVPLAGQISGDELPWGSGQQVPESETWQPDFPVVIDGEVIKCHGETHAGDPHLDEQLRNCGKIFRHVARAPFYFLVAKHTRVGLVRRIATVLEPLGEARLAVRPTKTTEAWRPSNRGEAFYKHTTRRVDDSQKKAWSDELVMAVAVPAGGCSEAEAVAKIPWMAPGARLARLPDAFAKCACEGDMDTMAALYWFMALDGYQPIRWNAWDEEVANQVGDDATYEQLAAALSAKYLATQR